MIAHIQGRKEMNRRKIITIREQTKQNEKKNHTMIVVFLFI